MCPATHLGGEGGGEEDEAPKGALEGPGAPQPEALDDVGRPWQAVGPGIVGRLSAFSSIPRSPNTPPHLVMQLCILIKHALLIVHLSPSRDSPLVKQPPFSFRGSGIVPPIRLFSHVLPNIPMSARNSTSLGSGSKF